MHALGWVGFYRISLNNASHQFNSTVKLPEPFLSSGWKAETVRHVQCLLFLGTKSSGVFFFVAIAPVAVFIKSAAWLLKQWQSRSAFWANE